MGNLQDNTIVGGSEPDGLYGLEGDDILKAGGGDDMLFGGSGDDTLVGGDGDDHLNGDEGDDVISPGLGRNTINGGPGSDTVIYGGNVLEQRGIHLDLPNGICMHGDDQDTVMNIENAYGTIYDDVLEGDDNDNILIGQGGDDTRIPRSARGYDILHGGNGMDTYDLAAANGTVVIQNFATDRILDRVMTYVKMSSLVYLKSNNDLIIQTINIQYPVFIDESKPIIVFKDWYVCQQLYQHLYIDTQDGRIATNVLFQHGKDAADRAAFKNEHM